jgi:hypothetical protein
MLNHPVEALHAVFIDTYKLIFREGWDQFTYGRNQFICRAVWCSRRSFLEHSKEEVTRRPIWTVSWGRDSTGFVAVRAASLFLLLCIVQMDHNTSKHFPPTVLTDVFHQIRNNRFDKVGCIIFHVFRNIQQIFNPCTTPNNRNKTLFSLTFCFGISDASSGFAAQQDWWKYFKRTSFRPLLICVQTHMVDLVWVSGEVPGKVRPATTFDRRTVNGQHTVNWTFFNANHCKVHTSKLPCRSSARDKVLCMRWIEIAAIMTE